jgi:hypothetical protein
LKLDVLMQMGQPLALTFFAPWAVSEDIAIFGYGIGTNGAGGAGVLHTSGKAIVTPVLF